MPGLSESASLAGPKRLVASSLSGRRIGGYRGPPEWSPLVRITDSVTGVVTYARTSDRTSVSVAPGARSTTQFTLPTGKSALVVVASGIASPPVTVTIS